MLSGKILDTVGDLVQVQKNYAALATPREFTECLFT